MITKSLVLIFILCCNLRCKATWQRQVQAISTDRQVSMDLVSRDSVLQSSHCWALQRIQVILHRSWMWLIANWMRLHWISCNIPGHCKSILRVGLPKTFSFWIELIKNHLLICRFAEPQSSVYEQWFIANERREGLSRCIWNRSSGAHKPSTMAADAGLWNYGGDSPVGV